MKFPVAKWFDKWFDDDGNASWRGHEIDREVRISKKTLHEVVMRMEQIGVRPERQAEAIQRYAGVLRYPRNLTEEEGRRFLEACPKPR